MSHPERTALFGDQARYVELDNARVELTNRAHALVQAHPDYTQALGRWRECMQLEQPSFADPAEVVRALKARSYSRVPTELRLKG